MKNEKKGSGKPLKNPLIIFLLLSVLATIGLNMLLTSFSSSGEMEITYDEFVKMIDNNEVTLKRFYKESDVIRLKPENDNMEDIIVEPSQEFAILGVAVGLMRNNIR